MTLERVSNKFRGAWLNWQYEILASRNTFSLENVLILAGDPRGGTTWLAEILKKLPGTAMLWEPLSISQVHQFRDLGFPWRQYIPENGMWPEARQTFDRLFSGRLLSRYLCRRTSPEEIRKARFLLIKFCRANQLLPWLTSEFQFYYAPIYIVRHPCAVVASQLNQGGWNHITPRFEIPEGRFASFYSDHQSFLSTVDTVEKKLAATWCLCNKVPLDHPENNIRWITLTYESMLQNPAKELNRIFSRWKIVFPENLHEWASKASETTVLESPIQSGKTADQLSHWKKQLTTKQKDDIYSVLQYFGIELYDSHELPRKTFVG